MKMMRVIASAATLVAGSSMAVAHEEAADRSAHVLIVVSGHGADGGKTRPGFEQDELSQAYAIFVDNGLTVDIASPVGGAVVAGGFDPEKPYNKRFLGDTSAAAKLGDTRALGSLRDDKYAAVFVIGGKGAMFDLPVNVDLKHLLAQTYGAGGVVGAVCHGPAALMNVPMPTGGSLIAGKAVTGFSNEEEVLFGKRWAAAFPVLLEDGLRGAGARFSEAPMMLSHVVADGRIVTGQNPYSTSDAAEAVVRAMGRQPVERDRFADERSMDLVAQTLAGEGTEARRKLTANPLDYDVPLLAAWGHSRAQTPGADRAMLVGAIAVMELAQPHYDEPRLGEAIGDAKHKLEAMP